MPFTFQFAVCAVVAFFGCAVGVGGIVLLVMRKWLGGCAAVGCGGLATIASAGWVVLWLLSMSGSESTDRVHFKNTFGFAAPPSVTDVRSFFASSTDSATTCMIFEADQATIALIVESADYEPDDDGIGFDCHRDLEWWDPPSELSFWKKQPYYENSSSWSRAILGCPPQGGRCYLAASAVD